MDISTFSDITNLLCYLTYVEVCCIQTFLWPNNIKNSVNVYFILLLYNCNMHRGLNKKISKSNCGIPEKLIVIFLLPNITSHYQHMDMGIIACFNVGYRVQLIKYLLQLFGVEEGYEAFEACR